MIFQYLNQIFIWFLHMLLALGKMMVFCVFQKQKIPHGSFNVAAQDKLELLSRLELPNLFLTKEVLYRLSYNSILTFRFRKRDYNTCCLSL